MPISLIIVSYNTSKLLTQCLDSIRRHEPDAETIVVDNASTDGSAELVARDHPWVKLVQMGRNAGFAAANNAGIRIASGDQVVLLNSDTVLEDDSLSRCAAWMREHRKVGATSPRLIGVDGQPQSESYPFPSLNEVVSHAFRGKPTRAADETRWIAGTALMIRAEALTSIGGGLDEGFWMYWEDADLSARLLAAGWTLDRFEDGHIIHYGGASGGGCDTTRRADLHAWYVFGRHRWFSKHRPRSEAAALWALDAVDVVRKWVRGTVRKNRAGERVHARVLAAVLWQVLLGHRPQVPGQIKTA